MKTTCSVIVLTARRLEFLEKCLASLAAQSRPPEEVVVVCTDGEDGTLPWVEGQDFATLNVRPLPGPEGGSFAEARNHGVREASGEWIAFLDDDCEADRPWLERLLSRAGDKDWDAAGGMVLPADELEAPDGYAPDLCWAAGLLPEGYLGPLGGRAILPSTSNLLARRSLLIERPFQEIGGEAGDYLAGREDSHWWRQARRSGARTGIVPRALVWHHVPAERLDPAILKERLRSDGAAHWIREHRRQEAAPAIRDILTSPIGALADARRAEIPLREAWSVRRGWAARQAAWLSASVDDHAPDSLSPGDRLESFFHEGARLLADGARSATRHLLSLGSEAWRRRPREEQLQSAPTRPVVILHDNLGDAVLALPMIRQLAEGLPSSEITVLCGRAGFQVLEANVPAEVDVQQIPAEAVGTGVRAMGTLRSLLAELEPDVLVAPYVHGLHIGAFYSHAPPFPVVTWNRDNGMTQQLWRDLVDFPVAKSWEKAEVAALLDLLAPLGLPARLERPRVSLTGEARAFRDNLLEKHAMPAGGYAVVQAEATLRYKDWPLENTLAVARHLAGGGLGVFLCGSPSDREEVLARVGGEPAMTVLHGEPDGLELAAILEGARLFFGPDSGPAHLAQAVGCPSVLLFGRTIRHRWEPLPPLRDEEAGGPETRILVAGSGDWLEEESWGLPPNAGMEFITVERGCQAADSLLKREKSGSGGEETR